MKLRGIVLFVTLLCLSQHLQAQYYFYDDKYYDNPLLFEFGGSIGAMNSLTDVGGRKGIGKRGLKDFNIKNTQVSGSVFFNAIYKNSVAVRLEGTFGQIKGYDSILAKVASSTKGRYERNLSFRSPITEILLVAEFHPVYIFGNFTDEHYPPALSPYLLAGVGYFHFNPQTQLNGVWIDLQPLRTEGQGFKEYPERQLYKLNQLNIPLGIGVKYELSTFFNIRAEAVLRKIQTDYLDDVSKRYIEPSLFFNYLNGAKLAQALQLNNRYRSPVVPVPNTAHPNGIRGNSENNDSYFNFSIKLSLIFNREKIR